jgi:Trm5-related predicted tRNA methylase
MIIRINNIIPIVIRGKLNGKTMKKPLNTVRPAKNKNVRIINAGTMNINKIRNIIRSKSKSPFIIYHL